MTSEYLPPPPNEEIQDLTQQTPVRHRSTQNNFSQQRTLISQSTQLENNKLREAQNNVVELIKRKYAIIRAFINKVIAPKSIHCLTDFNRIQHDTLVKNEKLNKELLKKYSETFNKIFGINSKVTKNTPDDKIKSDYIIKFIRLCLETIGYVMVRKIVTKSVTIKDNKNNINNKDNRDDNKDNKDNKIETIKTSYYTINLKPIMTFRK